MTPIELASLSIDATFATFGRAAVYVPPGGGAAQSCVVILDRQDRNISPGQSRGVVQGNVLEVRKAQLAAPEKDGSFVVDGACYLVREDPHHDEEDPERLVWLMRVS